MERVKGKIVNVGFIWGDKEKKIGWFSVRNKRNLFVPFYYCKCGRFFVEEGTSFVIGLNDLFLFSSEESLDNYILKKFMKDYGTRLVPIKVWGEIIEYDISSLLVNDHRGKVIFYKNPKIEKIPAFVEAYGCIYALHTPTLPAVYEIEFARGEKLNF